jgi:heme/copper-type cytochrome/quinol oxidase subunit 4
MAKRRKEGTEEEPLDFQIPKFDEAAYLKKERRNIKTIFISFLLGLLIAVICFGFWTLMQGSFLRWELVLLVGVVNAIWLRYIFLKLNIDLTDFGRKD